MEHMDKESISGERLKISIGTKFRLSSGIPYQDAYSDKEVAKFLREIASMLEAETVEDEEFF